MWWLCFYFTIRVFSSPNLYLLDKFLKIASLMMCNFLCILVSNWASGKTAKQSQLEIGHERSGGRSKIWGVLIKPHVHSVLQSLASDNWRFKKKHNHLFCSIEFDVLWVVSILLSLIWTYRKAFARWEHCQGLLGRTDLQSSLDWPIVEKEASIVVCQIWLVDQECDCGNIPQALLELGPVVSLPCAERGGLASLQRKVECFIKISSTNP